MIKKPQNKKMLIIEDDLQEIKHCIELANNLGYQFQAVTNAQDGLKILENQAPAVALIDMHLTQSAEQATFEGLDLLRRAKKIAPQTVLVTITADPRVDTYLKAIDSGAWAYVRKPITSSAELAVVIEAGRARNLLTNTSKRLPRNFGPLENLLKRCPDGIVLSQEIRTTIEKIAHVAINVAIVLRGETGTGKEEIAKLIHKRRCEVMGHIPFVAVNCAHLNSSIAHSVLFGHVKGAFTGADKTTQGLIAEADGGMLFLDEIHCLTLDSQKMLLRVLNDGEYQRVGETTTRYSDFQPIVASTKNLDQLINEGTFLPDLKGRLAGIELRLPPLRERTADFELLAAIFFAKEGVDISPEEVLAIAEKAKSFYWKGNIREFFGVLKSMIVNAMFSDEGIKAKDMPITEGMLQPFTNFGFLGSQINTQTSNLVLQNELIELVKIAATTDKPLTETMRELEKLILKATINRYSNRTEDIVKALTLNKSNFCGKRQEYEI